MNQPPLNPDALDRVRDAVAEALGDAYHCTRDWSAWSYGTMSQDDFSLAWEDSDFVEEMARAVLAAALPEVTSVEQWDALPIGTMVRVHFNGNSELIIRCPANSGAGIGGMSFLGGRHWSDAFTVWNADKLEIKYIPEVKP